MPRASADWFHWGLGARQVMSPRFEFMAMREPSSKYVLGLAKCWSSWDSFKLWPSFFSLGELGSGPCTPWVLLKASEQIWTVLAGLCVHVLFFLRSSFLRHLYTHVPPKAHPHPLLVWLLVHTPVINPYHAGRHLCRGFGWITLNRPGSSIPCWGRSSGTSEGREGHQVQTQAPLGWVAHRRRQHGELSSEGCPGLRRGNRDGSRPVMQGPETARNCCGLWFNYVVTPK